MREQRGIRGHLHNIGVSLQTRHEGCLHQGGVEMVALLPSAMAGIFPGKHLRTFSAVVVVTVALSQEPVFGTVEMLVDQIHFQLRHLGPQVVEILTL